MLGTGPTGLLQAFAKGMAGSMEADHEIVVGDSAGIREVRWRFPFQVYPLDDIRVFGLEGRQKPVQAGANLAHQFLIRRRKAILPAVVEVFQKCILLPDFRASGAIEIDQGIPEDAVKPSREVILFG